jgi:hypothetical protein
MFGRDKLTLALVFLACLLCGCARNPRAGVGGRVLLDNRPLDNGYILFQPAPGTLSPNAGASIEDGYYSVPAEKGPLPGRYRVEIHSFRKTGRKIPVGAPADLGGSGGMGDEEVEAIPARYNAQTTLECELQSGDNTHDFELRSK